MWQLPVKCLSTGIVESFTTARIRLSPPRGMTRSMYLSSLSRCGDEGAVGRFDKLHGGRVDLRLPSARRR